MGVRHVQWCLPIMYACSYFDFAYDSISNLAWSTFYLLREWIHVFLVTQPATMRIVLWCVGLVCVDLRGVYLWALFLCVDLLGGVCRFASSRTHVGVFYNQFYNSNIAVYFRWHSPFVSAYYSYPCLAIDFFLHFASFGIIFYWDSM